MIAGNSIRVEYITYSIPLEFAFLLALLFGFSFIETFKEKIDRDLDFQFRVLEYKRDCANSTVENTGNAITIRTPNAIF